MRLILLWLAMLPVSALGHELGLGLAQQQELAMAQEEEQAQEQELALAQEEGHAQEQELAQGQTQTQEQAQTQAQDAEPVRKELDTVREQIRSVEENISETRDQVEALRAALADNARKREATAGQLRTIEAQISEQQHRVDALSGQQQQRRQALRETEQVLAGQLRAAWKLGRYSTARLLLNQEQPEQVGRMLAWHAWQGQKRKEQIEARRGKLQEILDLRAELDRELLSLDELREEQEQRLQEQQAFRTSRKVLEQQLQAHIADQGRRLDTLRENERELQALFDRLEGWPIAPPGQERPPPFDTLRGGLDWPLAGRLLKRFGQDRLVAGGPLKWSGVLIAAPPGETVHTIGTGRVVYAEPFRGLDRLLIVDHGWGYMSLYGYNGQLLKKKGDWVLAGERIALVGDGVGRQQSGLYFEIRENGVPVNPAAWCRGR